LVFWGNYHDVLVFHLLDKFRNDVCCTSLDVGYLLDLGVVMVATGVGKFVFERKDDFKMLLSWIPDKYIIQRHPQTKTNLIMNLNSSLRHRHYQPIKKVLLL
jgi:hypothetical protein